MADKKINAHCIVCGNGYHMCLSCKDYAKTHPWQTYTDTAECYMIHQIIHGYVIGVYTKKEARQKLQNVDLSNIDNFTELAKKDLKEILEDENIIVSENIVETETETETEVKEEVDEILEVKESKDVEENNIKDTVYYTENFKKNKKLKRV